MLNPQAALSSSKGCPSGEPYCSSRLTADFTDRPSFWDAAAVETANLTAKSIHRGTSKRKLISTKVKRNPPSLLKELKPRRARTSEARKEEIELLKQEAKDLERQAEFLMFRTGAHDQQCLYQLALENTLLRECLRNQMYLVAGFKSALVMDTSDHFPSPLSSTICLGSDPTERRELLLAIKPQKTYYARQFLEKRTESFDMTKPFSESTQFETVAGEICASKLDVIPLYNAKSVKQVYDALLFHVLNIEMSTAEVNGDIVIREETETGDESVSQNRFVFLKNEFGVDVEANNVIFCEYSPSETVATSQFPSGVYGVEPQSDEGLITLDFVDEDELYPYRPSERMRDNVTGVTMVKSYRLPSPPLTVSQQSSQRVDLQNDVQVRECATNQEVVVLTKWMQAKFHRGAHAISDETLFDLRSDLDRVGDAVTTLVQARFRSPTGDRQRAGSGGTAAYNQFL